MQYIEIADNVHTLASILKKGDNFLPHADTMLSATLGWNYFWGSMYLFEVVILIKPYVQAVLDWAILDQAHGY